MRVTRALLGRASNHRTNPLQIRHHLIIPKPQHLKSLRYKKACSARVLFGHIRVLPTIYLDNQHRFNAHEIGDERTNGDLSFEL